MFCVILWRCFYTSEVPLFFCTERCLYCFPFTDDDAGPDRVVSVVLDFTWTRWNWTIVIIVMACENFMVQLQASHHFIANILAQPWGGGPQFYEAISNSAPFLSLFADGVMAFLPAVDAERHSTFMEPSS